MIIYIYIYLHTRIALISGINQAINAQICTDMHRSGDVCMHQSDQTDFDLVENSLIDDQGHLPDPEY
jgi:hypothetical protein